MEEIKVKIKNLNKEITNKGKIASKDIYEKIKDQLPYPCYLTKVNNAYRSLSHLL